MKRVGAVVGVAQGVAVVRSKDEEYPDVGTEVVTDSLDQVGRVVDVFGPVDKPYVAISPDTDRVAHLVGDLLYAR